MSEREEKDRTWQQQLLDVAQTLAPDYDKGEVYAVHFGAFLERLVDEEVIDDWIQTKQNSRRDRRGIDFLIAVGRERFGFQITSTLGNAFKRRVKHPGVYGIWMVDPETRELKTDEQLREQVEKGIEWYRRRRLGGK